MRSKPATQYIAWRNRMRTQHPNLWHPIRSAIMLIVLAWTIYGVCYEPPTDIFGVIWVAMLVTALVLSPLFLKSTSVAILVIVHRRSVYSLRAFGKFSSRAALRLWHARIQH